MNQRNIVMLVGMALPGMILLDAALPLLAGPPPTQLGYGPGLLNTLPLLLGGGATWLRLAAAARAFDDNTVKPARPLRQGIVLAFVSVPAALVVAALLKHAIGRARPWVSGSDPMRFEPFAFDDSFASLPSAQAACAAAVVLSLGHSLPWLRPWLLLLGGGVCVTRVATAAHWPSDVIAGWLLGAAIVHALARNFFGRAAGPGTMSA